MNYGNSQMARGRYSVAEEYFKRALKMWPYYTYLHTNLGVLNNAMGRLETAEQYFEKGIQYGKQTPEAYYHYGNWLHQQNRLPEAMSMLEEALRLSPKHRRVKELLARIDSTDGAGGKEARLENAELLAQRDPSTDNYQTLSLRYYRYGEYEKSVEAAQKALELNPASAAAWNNICVAYVKLADWDRAIGACRRALLLHLTINWPRTTWPGRRQNRETTNSVWYFVY
jgi:tetratricopeptide (TPR) repeat protein